MRLSDPEACHFAKHRILSGEGFDSRVRRPAVKPTIVAIVPMVETAMGWAWLICLVVSMSSFVRNVELNTTNSRNLNPMKKVEGDQKGWQIRTPTSTYAASGGCPCSPFPPGLPVASTMIAVLGWAVSALVKTMAPFSASP